MGIQRSSKGRVNTFTVWISRWKGYECTSWVLLHECISCIGFWKDTQRHPFSILAGAEMWRRRKADWTITCSQICRDTLRLAWCHKSSGNTTATEHCSVCPYHLKAPASISDWFLLSVLPPRTQTQGLSHDFPAAFGTVQDTAPGCWLE